MTHGSIGMRVAAFLAEHDLSPSSQRVYTSALRELKDGLGADTSLGTLDEPHAAVCFTRTLICCAGSVASEHLSAAPSSKTHEILFLPTVR